MSHSFEEFFIIYSFKRIYYFKDFMKIFDKKNSTRKFPEYHEEHLLGNQDVFF